MQASATVVSNAACNLCGCVCDDLELTVEADRILEAKNACALARPWFLGDRPNTGPDAMLDGEPIALEKAVDEAARILVNGRNPLVYGFTGTTCEAQRIGVAIADRIGGCIDTPTTSGGQSATLAMQAVGQITCSLGEVKNYADLVLFWGADPAKSHPRHGERYSMEARGLFVPNGRRGRTVIVVDSEETESSAAADVRLRIKPGMHFEVLWALRAIIKGAPVDPSMEGGTGVPLPELTNLAARMKSCKCGVLFFGADLSMSRGGHRNIEAAFSLARDLNQFTRWYALALGGPGNGIGAANVLTWQTGYPFAVNLNRSCPRFNPGEFTAANMLARGEVDAALIVGSDPLSDLARNAGLTLAAMAYVALDCKETPTLHSATVAFMTAANGVNVRGTVYRTDGVAIPLRPVLQSSRPSDEAVLAALEKRISALQHVDK